MQKFIHFAYSVPGYHHIRSGKRCQDASFSYSDDHMSVIAVADGHGGNDYFRSDRGSQYAVRCAVESIKTFSRNINENSLTDNEDHAAFLTELASDILSSWRESVDADLRKDPISKDDLEKVSESSRDLYSEGKTEFCRIAYGTTLIAACITRSCWFGLQIGDGKCAAFGRDGTFSEPIPWDDDCAGNITTSMCDEKGLEKFRFSFGLHDQIPAAIFISTDGLDNSYPYPPMEKVFKLYRYALQICMEQGEDIMLSQFKDHLPMVSQNGSSDDISVAGLIDRIKYQEALKAYNADSEQDSGDLQ